jgi:hypothetical protein
VTDKHPFWDVPMLEPNTLDKLIDWRMGDNRFTSKDNQRSIQMQRQFTMELRVDYGPEEDKNEVMRKAWTAAARHVYAKACLLSQGQKPKIALFSDDFFTGHEEIELLDDVIGKAVEADTTEESGVSSELMAAAKEMSGGIK